MGSHEVTAWIVDSPSMATRMRVSGTASSRTPPSVKLISGSALSALHELEMTVIWSRQPAGHSSQVVHTASTPSRVAWFMAVRTSW